MIIIGPLEADVGRVLRSLEKSVNGQKQTEAVIKAENRKGAKKSDKIQQKRCLRQKSDETPGRIVGLPGQ